MRSGSRSASASNSATAIARERYRTETGRPDPIDGAEPGVVRGANAWDAWRRGQVTQLVEDIATNARAARPGVEISAAVIAYDDRAYLSLAQDWRGWLRSGALDRAIPMAYTLDDALLLNQLEELRRLALRGSCLARARRLALRRRPRAGIGQLQSTRCESRDSAGRCSSRTMRSPRARRCSRRWWPRPREGGRRTVRERHEDALAILDDYDFELPESAIAQTALPERDAARLLLKTETQKQVARERDVRVRDLGDWLRPRDLLVVNATHVVPCAPGRAQGERRRRRGASKLGADPDRASSTPTGRS